MGQQSKRTRAPAPHLVPPGPRPLLPSAFPSTYGPGAWMPLRPPPSVEASSAPCWFAGLQQPRESSSAQGPCWAPRADIGGSTAPWYTTGNIDDSDPQACLLMQMGGCSFLLKLQLCYGIFSSSRSKLTACLPEILFSIMFA